MVTSVFAVGVLLLQYTLSLEYPPVFRNESVVDDYHGRLISDPYRWLEDPFSNATAEFAKTQNDITKSYLEGTPVRDLIRQKLTAMWNYAKVDTPIRHGGKFYYFGNTGLQNQNVLYVKETLTTDPIPFLDPNEFSPNGTIALSYANTFSNNGKIFAYSLSESGSDWMKVYFRETETGNDLPDVVGKIKFSMIAFDKEDKGIFYGAYPHVEDGYQGPIDNQKLFYHRLGTNQTEDILLAEFPDKPHWQFGIPLSVTRDGRHIIIPPYGEATIDQNAVYVAEIPENITGKLEWNPIIPYFESNFKFITSVGSTLYFSTNRNAPNRKVIAIDLDNPSESAWRTIVEEQEKKVIAWVTVADKDKLIISYLEDVKSSLSVFNLTDGSVLVERYADLEIGSIHDPSFEYLGYAPEDPLFFFKFRSILVPGRIYMIDFAQNMNNLVVYADALVEGFNSENFVSEQVFYPSYDGTMIPMFVAYKKTVALNGSAYLNLYGYGGFAVITFAEFTAYRALLLSDFNGIVAVANIRGGGEYGDPWHAAGRMENKQNSYDDFQAAAEYLIRLNYTSPSKIIIEGESNGGLLVAACLTQRPDLFAAAIPNVALTDMLRYHLFTIGYLWIPEYGTSANPEHFEFIVKYSPLHNIRVHNDTQFPAVLVYTAFQDDRVVPAHSLKFISELQWKIGRDSKQTNPLLIRIEDEAGHGSGKPTSKQIEERVDILSFLVQSIGLQLSV